MGLFGSGEASAPPDGLGRRLVLWALIAVLAWSGLRAALYIGYLGSYPYQVEDREEAQVRSALALKQGRDPWDPSYAPQDFNAYGLLYPWTAAHLLPSADLDLRHCRCLSLAAVLTAAFLLAAAAGSLSSSVLAGAGAGLAALGGYLFFVTPTTRCDAFAALFFIAPLALYILYGGGRRDKAVLAICVLCAVLAFFTKPYAAASGPLLAMVLYAEGRKRPALGVGLAWAFSLAVLVLVVEYAYPGYLEETIFLQATATLYNFSYFLMETHLYFNQALPLCVLAAFAGWRFRPLDRKTLAWTLPALAMALLMLWMGWNPGALLEYHFQLLHPCLLLAVAALWRSKAVPERRAWLAMGLAAAAFININFGTETLGRFESVNFTSWGAAKTLVAGARLPLLPPLLDSLATERGLPVFDNGETTALFYASGGASAAAVRLSYNAWTRGWMRALRERRVDLIVDAPNLVLPKGSLDAYVPMGRLCLPTVLTAGPDTECFEVYSLARKPGGPPEPSPAPAGGSLSSQSQAQPDPPQPFPTPF